MPKRFGFEFELGTDASSRASGPAPDDQSPLRIVILGDFSGRASRGVVEPGTLRNRRLRNVDRDNLGEAMAAMGVEVRLAPAGRLEPVTLPFRELDDFHPDRLYERIEAFGSLRELRRRLGNPQTFAAAVEELVGGLGLAAPSEPGPAAAPPPPTAPSPQKPGTPAGPSLDQLLEKTEEERASGQSSGASPWEALVAEIVRPYVLPKPDPKQAEYVASVDAAAGELMRKILHLAYFQAVEAAWRAVDFLVCRLETGTRLKLFLLDVSKAELAADLLAADDLETTGTYELLAGRQRQAPDAERWGLLLADFTFGPAREDAELLGRLGRIACQATAPLLAAASPRLLGCESLAEPPEADQWQWLAGADDRRAWNALRRIPEASCVGLLAPRFLLRLPYGPKTSPTEALKFDEMPGEPDHEAYLWGNPCFACACLIGQAFTENGWELLSGMPRDVEGLPVHVYRSEGESVMKPCAETELGDRAVDAMLSRGVMPLLSFRSQGTIRLAAMGSISDPASPLRGRWS